MQKVLATSLILVEFFLVARAISSSPTTSSSSSSSETSRRIMSEAETATMNPPEWPIFPTLPMADVAAATALLATLLAPPSTALTRESTLRTAAASF